MEKVHSGMSGDALEVESGGVVLVKSGGRVQLLPGATALIGDVILDATTGSLQLPPVLADQACAGIAEAGRAGAALAFGELCYFASTGKWLKAKADAAATSANKLGLCILAAAADGAPTAMLLFGKLRADSLFPTMTIGAPVYASAATAGRVTSTAPTGTTDFVVRVVGHGNTADELHFAPSADYLTLA